MRSKAKGNSRRDRAHQLRAALLVGGAVIWPTVASAQETQPQAIEEIIVTALKRATSIQTTPISISAVSAEAIANSGVQTIADLGASVPGLNFVNSGPSFSRVVIRGINAAGEPTVGVYYDETPVTGSVGTGNSAGASTPEFRLFDVDRVEVLRGPQGTLYGSGSMGGTLRTIYKKPGYAFEAAADASLSKTDGASNWNYEAQGVVNVPVVEDKVAVRLVGFYRDTGGYIDNTFLKIDGINASKTYGGRALVRVEPHEALTIDLAYYMNRTEAGAPYWLPVLGKFKSDARVRQPINDDLDLYSITANYDLGPVKAVGAVSYLKRDLSSVGDTSLFIAAQRTPGRCQSIVGGGAACSAAQLAGYYAFVDGQYPSGLNPQEGLDTYTAEIRFSSDYQSPVQWTLGGFYSDRNSKVWNPAYLANAATGEFIQPEILLTGRRIDDTLKQYAAFGDLSFDLTDKLNLTAGARYFKYTKDIIGETPIPNVLVGAQLTPPTRVASDEKGWVFRFNGSYKLTPNAMLYAEASQGFRPGGANQVLGLPGNLTPYDSDTLWNYELGVKTSFWDRRAIFNADVFQIDWSDMQVSQRTPNGAFSYIGNAGKARIRGVEIDAQLRPATGLTITGNASFMDAELTANQPLAGAVASAGYKGDRIPYVPRKQAGIAITYERPLKDGLNGMARIDYNYVGSSFNEFRTQYVYARKIQAYDLINARLGIEATDRGWGAYLFASNLANETAILTQSASAVSLGRTNVFSATPRTIGLNLRKTLQ